MRHDRPATAVYLLHDRNGSLLYVGLSACPSCRFKYHAKKRPWWDEVDPDRHLITWYKDRFAAAAMEQQNEHAASPRYGKDMPAFGRLYIKKLIIEGYDVTPISAPLQSCQAS